MAFLSHKLGRKVKCKTFVQTAVQHGRDWSRSGFARPNSRGPGYRPPLFFSFLSPLPPFSLSSFLFLFRIESMNLNDDRVTRIIVSRTKRLVSLGRSSSSKLSFEMDNSSWGRQQLASLKSLSQIGALRRATFRSKKR